jgi:hypothetical protein
MYEQGYCTLTVAVESRDVMWSFDDTALFGYIQSKLNELETFYFPSMHTSC